MTLFTKKRTLIAAVILSALVMASSAYVYLGSGKDWVDPKIGPITEAVYGVGAVTSWNTYNLKVSVAQLVREEYVTEGQTVKKGQRLILFTEGDAYRAPFDGTVTALNYKIRETVTPQMTVLTVTDLDHRYILVSLEQSGALRVRQGQAARLTFEDVHMTALDGRVTSVYPQAGQFLVRIDVPEFPEGVMVGMVADVAIQVARRDGVLQIPVASIHGEQATVLRNGKTQSVNVKVGAADGLWAEIVNNLILPTDKVQVPKAR